MSVAPADDRPRSPYDVVRARCRSLGLPTWQCDSNGVIVEEPTESGIAGLLLRSRAISDIIWQTVKTWDAAAPEIVRVQEGCWLIAVSEEYRRRRAGFTIAMAIGTEMLEAEGLRAICRSAQLDIHAAKAALRRLAKFDEDSVRHAAAMIRWMVQDLHDLSEHRGAVEGFTRELTDSYETIDLLYSLGRSMNSISDPERFVHNALDRLQETMSFGWLAARFTPESRLGERLRTGPMVRGAAPCAAPSLDAGTAALLERAAAESSPFLVFDSEEAGFSIASPLIVQPVLRESRLAGVLIGGDKQGDDPQVSSYDMQLLEAAASNLGAFLENSALYADQQSMFLGSLKALTAAIDAKDRYTCGHSERVAMLAQQLASAVGLDRAQAERVHICGLVHDVGKIGVPEAVLCKPGRLTPEEFGQIKLHPEIGHRILRDIPLLEDVLPGVMHHHERWDGRGYPHGLAGERIPLFARLLGLADTFDAMSSTRSYRAAMPRDQVLAEIRRCAGAQFDPSFADAFAALDFAAYDEMVARHASEHASAALRAA